MLDRLLFRNDLNLHLFTLYLLFVAPVIAAALFFGALTRLRLERDIKAADLTLARSIAAETTTTFQNSLRTVEQIAQRLGSVERSQAELSTLFAAAVAAREEIDLIYILDDKGIVRYHYPEGPVVVVGVDFSFRPYFYEALAAEQALISSERIALSPATGRAVITIAAPLRDQGKRSHGLIAADLDLRHLSAMQGQVFVDHTSGLRVSTVNRAGQIIADSQSGRLFMAAQSEFPEAANAALTGLEGNEIGHDGAGRQWLRSYTAIQPTNWAVIIQRPTDLAFASPRAFQTGLLIAIAVFIIGGIFFWLLLARWVIAPLERLAEFSTAIAQRTVVPTDHTRLAHLAARPDQMGRLVIALTHMEQAIDRRFTELSTLFETSSAVVSTLDLSLVLDTILEQVQRLFGVERCAIIALDEPNMELRLQAARGLSDCHLQRIQRRPIPAEIDSPSLRSIRSRENVMIEKMARHPFLADRAHQEGYQALMAVPLLTRHALPSALLVYWSDEHTCSAEEIDLVAHFANYATMALENAALFARTDEKLREQTYTLEALVQSLNDGLILESSERRILYCNRRICELADLTAAEIVRFSPAALRARLLANAVVNNGGEHLLADLIYNNQSNHPSHHPSAEITLRYRGQPLDLRIQSFAVIGGDHEPMGRGELWLDVTSDKELDRMKSSLIATVSHELRTPLAIIKGNLSSLLAHDVTWDTETQQEFIRVAHREVDRLSALVTDLLDLSRIEAGTLSVEREQCALPEIVARSAAHTRSDQRLHLSLPPTLPLFLADPVRIEVVMRNLIENACKYSPPASAVVVSAGVTNSDEEKGLLWVAVTNAGLPIPIEEQARVFERFHRLESGLTRQTSGAGLGLAICKGFVEAHGGKIWVESDEVQTVFHFTLPLN